MPCRCRSPAVPVTRPACAEAREGVRDRWPLGRDELAEQPVGERQRHADAGRLDAPPARRQVPEQQHEADLEPRLAGDRPQRVDVGGAPAGAAQQLLDDLRPGPNTLRERRRRAARSGSAQSTRQASRRSSRSSARWPAAGADRRRRPARWPCGRRPASRTPTTPSRISSPGPGRPRRTRRARSQSPTAAWSTRAVASCRAATRVRMSNSSARSSSCVEDVRVERRRLGLAASEPGPGHRLVDGHFRAGPRRQPASPLLDAAAASAPERARRRVYASSATPTVSGRVIVVTPAV